MAKSTRKKTGRTEMMANISSTTRTSKNLINSSTGGNQKPKAYCLVCGLDLTPGNKTDEEMYLEVYPELFRTFCKYMKWDAGTEDQEFKFDKELFPFCHSCQEVVVDVYNLNESIENLLQRIDTLTSEATTKILVSQEKDGEGEGGNSGSFRVKLDSEEQGASGKSLIFNGEKVLFYRNLTIRRFMPTVDVKVENVLSMEEVEEEEDPIAVTNNDDDTNNSEPSQNVSWLPPQQQPEQQPSPTPFTLDIGKFTTASAIFKNMTRTTMAKNASNIVKSVPSSSSFPIISSSSALQLSSPVSNSQYSLALRNNNTTAPVRKITLVTNRGSCGVNRKFIAVQSISQGNNQFSQTGLTNVSSVGLSNISSGLKNVSPVGLSNISLGLKNASPAAGVKTNNISSAGLNNISLGLNTKNVSPTAVKVSNISPAGLKIKNISPASVKTELTATSKDMVDQDDDDQFSPKIVKISFNSSSTTLPTTSSTNTFVVSQSLTTPISSTNTTNTQAVLGSPTNAPRRFFITNSSMSPGGVTRVLSLPSTSTLLPLTLPPGTTFPSNITLPIITSLPTNTAFNSPAPAPVIPVQPTAAPSEPTPAVLQDVVGEEEQEEENPEADVADPSLKRIVDNLLTIGRLKDKIRMVNDRTFIYNESYPFKLNSNNKWVCMTCQREFSNKFFLESHLLHGCKGYGRAKKLPTVFSREIGKGKFEYRGFLFEKLPSGLFKCSNCKFTSLNKNHTTTHILKSHYSTKVESGGRTKRIRNRSVRSNMHFVVKIDETKYSYRGFLINKLANGNFKCVNCQNMFTSQNYVTTHIRRAHIKEEPKVQRRTSPSYCEKLGDNKFRYRGFLFESLPGPKFNCLHCQYSSWSKNYITTHILYSHCSEQVRAEEKEEEQQEEEEQVEDSDNTDLETNAPQTTWVLPTSSGPQNFFVRILDKNNLTSSLNPALSINKNVAIPGGLSSTGNFVLSQSGQNFVLLPSNNKLNSTAQEIKQEGDDVVDDYDGLPSDEEEQDFSGMQLDSVFTC